MRISDWSSDVCSSDLVGFSLYSEPGVGLPIAPLISGEGTSFTMGTGFYGGALYGGPEYTGHWNFADAVILSVVPEPGAWLTMIAGFGLTGLALRRRTTGRILPDALRAGPAG